MSEEQFSLREFVWPSFPQQYLLLVSDDKVSTHTEEDLEVLHSFKNKILLSSRKTGDEFFLLGAPSVTSLSTVEKPLSLFKDRFLMWFGVWYGIVYTLFVLPVLVEELFFLYSTWWYMSIITSLAWYVGLTIYRFSQPTVRFLAAMLVGEYAGAPVYLPYPFPYSTLSVKKYLEMLDRNYYEVMISRTSEAELKAALSVMRTENALLARELAEHKVSFENAATIVRQRLLKTSDWLQQIEIAAYQRRMLVLAGVSALIALVLGLALGFVLSGGGVMISAG